MESYSVLFLMALQLGKKIFVKRGTTATKKAKVFEMRDLGNCYV